MELNISLSRYKGSEPRDITLMIRQLRIDLSMGRAVNVRPCAIAIFRALVRVEEAAKGKSKLAIIQA